MLVMGDTVNLASRLESANNFYGTRCLAVQATIAAAAQAVEAREIDNWWSSGCTRPQTVFEIMGRAIAFGRPDPHCEPTMPKRLAAYRARHWDDATSGFKSSAGARSADGPCMVLLTRVENLRENPPGADWDGSWRLDQKSPATGPSEVSRP